MRWIDGVGYGQFVFDDEYYFEPCAAVVTTTDLLRGCIRIPRLNLTMPNRLKNAYWTNRKAKMFMTITPHNMNLDDDAVIMDSKNLLEFDRENEEFYSYLNVVNRGGTLYTDYHNVGVATQDYQPMDGLEIYIRWGRDAGADYGFRESANLLEYESGNTISIYDVFQITIHRHSQHQANDNHVSYAPHVRVRSKKLGIDIDTKDLCRALEDGTT